MPATRYACGYGCAFGLCSSLLMVVVGCQLWLVGGGGVWCWCVVGVLMCSWCVGVLGVARSV